MGTPLYYDDDEAYDVQVGDEVKVDIDRVPDILKREQFDGFAEGVVTKVYEKTSVVVVKYDTGETWRTTGRSKFATKRFKIEDVVFIARSE